MLVVRLLKSLLKSKADKALISGRDILTVTLFSAVLLGNGALEGFGNR